MKKRKYILFALPVIIILAMCILIYISKNPSKFWHCSATKPRGDDLETWKSIINPEFPSVRLDKDFFNKFTVSSDEEQFTIDYPHDEPQNNPFPFELYKMPPDQSLKIGSSTLEFLLTGIALPKKEQNLNDGAYWSFYNNKFEPITEKRYRELDRSEIIPSSRVDFGLSYPDAMFIFMHDEIEDLLFNRIMIFDSQTHKQLLWGIPSSNHKNSFSFQGNIPLWHCTPVDLVLDISYGPTKTYEFAPIAGEGFEEENFSCRLLNVFENVDIALSRQDIIRKTSQFKKGQRFYFICQPQAIFMPVQFELLDNEGNKIKTKGGATSAYTHHFNTEEPLDNIALIRAKYYTKRCRIIIHLPHIPGLPEQNTDIKDILNVNIPYANFKNHSVLGQFLKKTLQLDKLQNPGPLSANKVQFPIDCNDVTIRDIAEIWSTGGSLKINVKKDQLILEYPVPFLTKLKNIFSKNNMFIKESGINNEAE